MEFEIPMDTSDPPVSFVGISRAPLEMEFDIPMDTSDPPEPESMETEEPEEDMDIDETGANPEPSRHTPIFLTNVHVNVTSIVELHEGLHISISQPNPEIKIKISENLKHF